MLNWRMVQKYSKFYDLTIFQFTVFILVRNYTLKNYLTFEKWTYVVDLLQYIEDIGSGKDVSVVTGHGPVLGSRPPEKGVYPVQLSGPYNDVQHFDYQVDESHL